MGTEVKFRYYTPGGIENGNTVYREYVGRAQVIEYWEDGERCYDVSLLEVWDMGLEFAGPYKEVFPFTWEGKQRLKIAEMENEAIQYYHGDGGKNITIPYNPFLEQPDADAIAQEREEIALIYH